MIGLFTDSSRAFDTISHDDVLLLKLNHYGIRGKSLLWIEEYLTNGKQYVNYNNENSKMGNECLKSRSGQY